MKFEISLCLFLVYFQALAQQIVFTDETTGERIPGVAVEISTLDDRLIQVVSDAEGRIDLNVFEFPLSITTQHLTYRSLQLELAKPGNYTHALVPKETQLADVVVTGQFAPTSAERSVFKVQRILREEFQARGAVSLEDALKSQLNIDINQDLAIGSATVSMQGINSQNVKILVDGIPLVNRNGNGNGADLSQITLQHIERIEVIEGPMAVNYGANALAGVINLITIQEETSKPTGQLFLQSETVGNEWGLDAGRHIQGALVDFGIIRGLNAQISAQHNNFLGFKGTSGPRAYEWNPKQQLLTDLQLSYKVNGHQVKYKLGYLNELIQAFGTPQNNFLPNGQNQPFAIDEDFQSERITHQLLLNGENAFIKHYNAYFSYSDFERVNSQFSKNLVTLEETLTTGEGDQDVSGYSVFDAGATFNFAISDLNVQAGYQVSMEEARGGRILEGAQRINDYSLFSSAEWTIHEAFTLRPGLRMSYNNAYGSQAVPSLQTKWRISENDQMRFSYGQGFRAPSVRELYFEFVDSNHRIFGNPDLLPEQSAHFSLNYDHGFSISGKRVKAELNLFYNDINQQIAIAQSPNDPTSTTYLNIEKFRTLGFNLVQQINYGALSGNVGVSYIGRYNRLSSQSDALEAFFYTPEFNTNVNYHLEKTKSSINLYYKYSGVKETYFLDDEDNVSIGQREAIHWMDLSLNQKISNSLSLLLGARNLLNVRDINNSGVGTGVHSGGGAQPISYGRSYFIKLNYNIN